MENHGVELLWPVLGRNLSSSAGRSVWLARSIRRRDKYYSDQLGFLAGLLLNVCTRKLWHVIFEHPHKQLSSLARIFRCDGVQPRLELPDIRVGKLSRSMSPA